MSRTEEQANPHASTPKARRTWVVGTAGHVDHGKSTLVRALTGIDPDRLQEEREREMTIDLGFAWLPLPDGSVASVIDVPGHERFIKNMLAGVGGIDAALLVVAADEGPMPQTDEHLAIIDLLEIERGVVALTKSDLVDDEWLELVSEETRERLAGTVLAHADIVPVSSIAGVGLEKLVDALHTILVAMPDRQTTGRPRLAIDRAFSATGFGTVVTGTLLGGTLEVGQDVEIAPAGLRARIRGLQSHGVKTDRALPGARTAVNLSGIDRDAIQRGDVLTSPGWLRSTTRIDARIRLIADAPAPLEHNDPVDVFIGAAETLGNVTLLGSDRLLPGEEGWAQIRLAREIAAVDGDRIVIRQPSPSVTIGGGRIVDAHPRRHRRFRPEVIADLETRATGTPAERVIQAVTGEPRTARQVTEQTGLTLDDLRRVVADLVSEGTVVVLGADPDTPLAANHFLARSDEIGRFVERMTTLLGEFHGRHPLRRGMPREDVRSRVGAAARVFDAIVLHAVASGGIADHGNVLALSGHELRLTPAQQQAADRYSEALAANPNSPPGPDAFGIDPDLLAALVDMGRIVRLPDNVVFGAEQLAKIRAETLALIDRHGTLTLAQFRDHFGSSRKYAQAVLEYFDQTRVTRRVGDARVRGPGAG